MTNAILFGVVFGLIAGFFVARASARSEPIYAGGSASFLHYLVCSIVSAMPVTIIGVVITSHDLGGTWVRLGYALLTAIVFSGMMYGSALLFANQERPARERAIAEQEASGWTEKDARTSGL